MNYSCRLRFYCDVGKFYKCFLPELEKQNRKRASFDIKKQKDCIEFDITAKDSVALRATVNHITKLFTVCEQMERVGA